MCLFKLVIWSYNNLRPTNKWKPTMKEGRKKKIHSNNVQSVRSITMPDVHDIIFTHSHIFEIHFLFGHFVFFFLSSSFRNCSVLSSHFILFYFIFFFLLICYNMPTRRINGRSSETMTKKQRRKQNKTNRRNENEIGVESSVWVILKIWSFRFAFAQNEMIHHSHHSLLLTREWKWISINNSTIVRRNNQNQNRWCGTKHSKQKTDSFIIRFEINVKFAIFLDRFPNEIFTAWISKTKQKNKHGQK